MTDRHHSPGQAIIDVCLEMNRAGINQGTAGNVSVRHDDGCLITPSGVDYHTLDVEGIVPIDLKGRVVANRRVSGRASLKPSSEWRMHVDIYARIKEAGAVIHAHPPYATALACQRRKIPAFHYMVAIAGGMDIRCADYATFGTAALSDNMIRALEGRSACLLANHGMICFGRDLDDALWRAIEVESLARQYVLSLAMGDPVLLDKAEMDEVLTLFKTYGKPVA